MPLNDTQIYLLDAGFDLYIEDILENAPTIEVLKKALNSLSKIDGDSIEEKEYKNYGLKDSIDTLRKILLHPHPQNRAESYPYCGQISGFAAYPVYGHQETRIRRRRPAWTYSKKQSWPGYNSRRCTETY